MEFDKPYSTEEQLKKLEDLKKKKEEELKKLEEEKQKEIEEAEKLIEEAIDDIEHEKEVRGEVEVEEEEKEQKKKKEAEKSLEEAVAVEEAHQAEEEEVQRQVEYQTRPVETLYEVATQNTVERLQQLTYQNEPWSEEDIREYTRIRDAIHNVSDHMDNKYIKTASEEVRDVFYAARRTLKELGYKR